jgi:hypothetical protein
VSGIMGRQNGPFPQKSSKSLYSDTSGEHNQEGLGYLLEVGTIVGSLAEKIRVAVATLDKKIVTKYNIFLRKAHYLVLGGYDPRIHALYFCPQLYKYNSDKQLVASEGEEIGRLLAQSVKDGVIEKLPWYEPSNNCPPEPVISPTTKTDFDTMIVSEPSP